MKSIKCNCSAVTETAGITTPALLGVGSGSGCGELHGECSTVDGMPCQLWNVVLIRKGSSD